MDKVFFIIISLIIIFFVVFVYFYKTTTWNKKLEDFENGIILQYPKNIKTRFYYETSIIKLNSNSPYEERFIQTNSLDNAEYDKDTFSEYFTKENLKINSHAVSFYNKSGDTLLICPTPYKNNKYITIKEFIDLAPKEQQIEFWRFVAANIKEYIKNNGQAYVSTHGNGVSYFHLRICNKPKYYVSDLASK